MSLDWGSDPVPPSYLQTCPISNPNATHEQGYCALSSMADEAIGETMCKLQQKQMDTNVFIVVASDNGGLLDMTFGHTRPARPWGPFDRETPPDVGYMGLGDNIEGIGANNYPLRGGKFGKGEGGVRTDAVIYSPIWVSSSLQGTTYDGLAHVTDWLPTIMQVATRGQWERQLLSGYPLDGLDLSAAISESLPSPREEVFHGFNAYGTGALMYKDHKILSGGRIGPAERFQLPPRTSIRPSNVSFIAPVFRA